VAVAGLAVGGLVASSAPAGAAPFGYMIVEDFEDGCTLHRIDLATGALDPAPAAPSAAACATDLAFSPDGGTLYGAFDHPDTASLVRFDLATGVPTDLGQIGDFPANFATDALGGGGLAFDATGVLYVTLFAEDPDAPVCQASAVTIAYCTYRVDPANPGAAEFVGRTTAEDDTPVGAFASACDGGFVGSEYLEPVEADGFDDAEPDGNGPDGRPASDPTLDEELGEPAAFVAVAGLTNVNRSTGLGTIVGPFGEIVTGFDFDQGGALYGVGVSIGGASNVVSIDRTTGLATVTAPIALESGNEVPLALAIPKVCELELTFTG
jgi:hypothetical protein